MQMYAESSGTSADLTKLTAARDQACRYAHESGWLPETMVIALRHALESLGAFGQVPHSGSRAAYDRLVAGSLRVYFETRL